MSLPDGMFFSSRTAAVVPPPPPPQGPAPGRREAGVPHPSSYSHGAEHEYVFLSGQHATAPPVSTSRPAARPFLAGAALGQLSQSAAAAASRGGSRAVGNGAEGLNNGLATSSMGAASGVRMHGGGRGAADAAAVAAAARSRRRAVRRAPRMTAPPAARPNWTPPASPGVPPVCTTPRPRAMDLAAWTPAPPAPRAADVAAWTPAPPVRGSLSEAIDGGAMEDGYNADVDHRAAGGNRAPFQPPQSSLQRPMAGPVSTLPVGFRRGRAAAVSRSPSPPPSRARHNPPHGRPQPGSSAAAAPLGATAVIASEVSEMGRIHKEAMASVRREVTVTRKELAVTNSNIRALTQKTDQVAEVADQLSVAMILQRRVVVQVGADVAASVARALAVRAPTSGIASAALAPDSATAAGASAALPDPRTQDEMETQDAKWVLQLKTDLGEWVRGLFLNSTCTADVWLSTKDVNIFLRDWTMNRFRVSAKEAVRMLESSWRLPRRPRRRAAPSAESTPPTDAPSMPGTIAYQYLHRVISHFYQKVGAKIVSAFASHVNEDLGKGTLRRLRGTTSKFEIFFSREDAKWLLDDDRFLIDHSCCEGLVRAVAAVFSHFRVLHRFSESGPTEGGPRAVACRLAYFAVAATKIRAHLKMRTSAKAGEPAADGTEAAADKDGEEDADDAEVDTSPVGGAGCLNSGHRPEWIIELQTVSRILAPQGASVRNGLHVTDGDNPLRADATRPQPSPAASSTAGREAARVSAPAIEERSCAALSSLGSDGINVDAASRAQRGAGLAPERNSAQRDADGRAREGNWAARAADGGVPEGMWAARAADDSSDDMVTCSDQDEEEAPTRRKRTPMEMREAAARRGAARVLMGNAD